jgi:hypothetical protein
MRSGFSKDGIRERRRTEIARLKADAQACAEAARADVEAMILGTMLVE